VVVALVPDLVVGNYRRALAVGVDGVCDADLPPEMIARVVDAAVSGEVTLPAEMARRLAAGSSPEGRSPSLSADEQALLQGYADGTSIPDLAKKEFLGERTVRRRLQNICLKLGARSRSEAIKRATQLGIIG
jgi:two-component system response regulator DesR